MAQLVSATWAVTARHGTIEPSVREILAEAGLSTKAFYRHFRAKDELLLAALEQGSHLLVDHLERRMAAATDEVGRIDAWIVGFVRQAANRAAARRTLPWTLGAGRLATDFPDALGRNQGTVIAPLERQIRAAVANGRSTSPDPASDAQIIFSFTADTLRRYLARGTGPEPTTVRQLVDFAHRALGLPDPR